MWQGTLLTQLKIWHIWDTIRFRRQEASWHHLVWHKLKILRYAHHQCLVCLGRISTLDRLASFGLQVKNHCYLCVGGLETVNHLFVHYPYSASVLLHLASLLDLYARHGSWLEIC